MFVENEKNVRAIEKNQENMSNVTKKILISYKNGWEDYVMRLFEIGPGGHTLKHHHPWPHINYVVEGFGKIFISGKYIDIEKGSFAYISSDEEHQFLNTSDDKLKIICIVPKHGEKDI